MNDISLKQLYEYYLDTVDRCAGVLNRSDEEIAYDLFEEFDIGAHTFLHDDNLAKLRDAGYIDEETVAMSKEARKMWLILQSRNESVTAIKTDPEWRVLFDLCDRIKSAAVTPGKQKR